MTHPSLTKPARYFLSIWKVCAIYPTLLMPLSAIASKQASPTIETGKKVEQSNMILTGKSNGGYLNQPNAHNQAREHFSYPTKKLLPPKQWHHTQHCTNNKTCHVICSKSRIGSLIHQCKRGSLHLPSSSVHGLLRITYTKSNRQFDSQVCHQQQSTTKTGQSNRYALPLAT